MLVHVGLARLQLARGAYDELISGIPEVLTLASDFGEKRNRAQLHITVAHSHWHHSRLREALDHVRRTAREFCVRFGAGLGIHQGDELMAALAEFG